MAGKAILDELANANATATEKATPEEAEAFRTWLLECAQRAADAAKEGGFMGFNAVRVSEGEQRMLDELASTLGVEPRVTRAAGGTPMSRRRPQGQRSPEYRGGRALCDLLRPAARLLSF